MPGDQWSEGRSSRVVGIGGVKDWSDGRLPPDVEIRRATMADREAILEVVETSFAPPGGSFAGAD